MTNFPFSNASDSFSTYFGYNGHAHPAVFAWLLSCFSGLTLQVRLLLGYIRSKPPIMISLVDLVNADVVRANFFLGCNVLLPYMVASLGLRILYLPGAAITFFLPFSFTIVLVYLTVAAMVHFLLIHLCTTSLHDAFSDEQTRLAIRAIVLLFCTTANVVKILNNVEHRDSMAEAIVHPFAITPNTLDMGRLTKTAVRSLSILVLVCVANNILLRGWMYWKKKKTLQEAPPPPLSSAGPMSQYTWTVVIAVFVVFAMGILAVSLHRSEGQQSVAPLLRPFLGIPTICLGMPLSLILSEKKLKQTLFDRFMNVCSCCKTEVAPAQH